MVETIGMDDVMRAIWHQMILHMAEQTNSRGRYDYYKSLLPDEVVLVKFLEGSINCAGYALDLDRTTSEPSDYIGRDFIPVDRAIPGGIYLLYSLQKWIHLGKIVDEEMAESKWGWHEPVFKHPILFYPGPFDDIKFFQRRNS